MADITVKEYNFNASQVSKGTAFLGLSSSGSGWRRDDLTTQVLHKLPGEEGLNYDNYIQS